MSEDIEELRRKIITAQRWLKEHFNVQDAELPGLVKEQEDGVFEIVKAAFVTFTGPDTAIVEPSICGKPIGIEFHYRLGFHPGGIMAWHGKHPFYHTDMPPLWVDVFPEEAQ